MLVAEGAMDVAVDAVGVAPYDIAAIQPIVEAAGGKLTDRRGVATFRHDTAISSNRLLHDIVIEHLAG
jgi:histidinol-phosphatase